MNRFDRQVLGYHGCTASFAASLLGGSIAIEKWALSENDYDWLGTGVYFWEHSPQRAWRWATDHCGDDSPMVVGAVIQLGKCLDLMNEEMTKLLADSYEKVEASYGMLGKQLPLNRGPDRKARYLDCLVINNCLDELDSSGEDFDTVRGAFEEGEEAYPGASFAKETHIQIAVRNRECIMGVFRPNLGHFGG